MSERDGMTSESGLWDSGRRGTQMIAKAFIIVVAFTLSVLITPSVSQAQHRGHVPRLAISEPVRHRWSPSFSMRSGRACATAATLKDKISLSNTAGQKGTTSASRISSLTW